MAPPAHTLAALAQFAQERMTRWNSIESEDSAQDREFDAAVLALCRGQFELNPVCRQFWRSSGIDIASEKPWWEWPPIPTRAFKEFAVTCLAGSDRQFCFCSSGTTAASRGKHFHNALTLGVYESSLLPWFEKKMLPAGQGQPTLLALTPPREQASESSLVHMLDTIAKARPDLRPIFAGGIDSESGWNLDFDRAKHAMIEAAAAHQPLLIAGTAFNFVHLIDHLSAHGLGYRLPAGTRVMETGGYKGRSRELSRTELHAQIATRLGIGLEWIVCEYGMSELSSQAYDCTAGVAHCQRRFRFPPWARARIVSPETGLEAACGEIGMLQIADLANVGSCCLLLTEDLAIRWPDGFEFVGRTLGAEAKGCSLHVV